MARVDFYVLSANGERARLTFACRLAEKAYRLENTVHILTADDTMAGMLDDMLWTFRDGSFVPHERVAPGKVAESPVTIASDPEAIRDRDLLINLRAEVPAVIEAFPRVAELVTSDADMRAAGRQRFTEYRNQGHDLETHKV